MKSCTSPRIHGFTLLESMISMALFALLVTSVFSIMVETSSLLGETNADSSIQQEGTRAFARVTELLRKSGRLLDAGIQYPRATGGGTEIEFRLLQDIDGNGYGFDQTTGDLEWNPNVYTLRLDSGELAVYGSATKLYPIARNVSFLRFDTVAEDTSLQMKEIAIALEIRKALPSGSDLIFSMSGSVHMRN